jgi:hypothetical protein
MPRLEILVPVYRRVHYLLTGEGDGGFGGAGGGGGGVGGPAEVAAAAEAAAVS